MKARLHYDPMLHGPQPLIPVTEGNRRAVDHMIDKLEAEITTAIIQNVTAGATPLFKRGYRINELQMQGFGNEITVEPIQAFHPIKLWWRRVLLSFQITKLPSFRQYGQIEALDHDTHRLITELKIFETYERSAEPQKGVKLYERRI